ncbi:hypothetical protein INR49_003865, partial [Caranx melampygus]
MKSPDEDHGLDPSSNQTQTEETLDTGVSPEPQQGEPHESRSEPGPEQRSPKSGPPTLAHIKSRMQQLQNRRFLLLQMQHFKKKRGGESSGTREDKSFEDSDEGCELEVIQKELEELLVKKKELENQGGRYNNTAGSHQGAVRPISYKTETPTGGIYTLPPPQHTEEDAPPEQTVRSRPAVETSAGEVVPVETLGVVSAITQCPFCREVVSTEIHSTVGGTMWLLCCLCSMMGCIAGCCLVPFFIDRMKNIHHHWNHTWIRLNHWCKGSETLGQAFIDFLGLVMSLSAHCINMTAEEMERRQSQCSCRSCVSRKSVGIPSGVSAPAGPGGMVRSSHSILSSAGSDRPMFIEEGGEEESQKDREERLDRLGSTMGLRVGGGARWI